MNSGTLTLFQSKTDNFALAYAGPETNIVICLPTKHLGVLMNSFKCVCAFQFELEFGSVGF